MQGESICAVIKRDGNSKTFASGEKEISWIKAHLSARLSNFAVEQSSFSFGGKCWQTFTNI